MTRTARTALALTMAAGLLTMEPLAASARTKSIVKYGAIGLGAAALYNLGQRSAHAHYHQPHYHYGYAAPQYYAPVYPAYPAYPAYAYPAPAPVYAYPSYGTSFHFSYSR